MSNIARIQLVEANAYYVYLHIKETTGEPFYVGKGKKNRAFEFSEKRLVNLE